MDIGRVIPTYQLLDHKNPVFGSFVVWSSVLVIKLILMSLLTAFNRFRTQVLFIEMRIA